MSIPFCFNSFISGTVIPPTLFFFLKIALAVHGLLWFHINFRILCSSSEKDDVGILIRIALNLPIVVGSMVIKQY